MISLLDQEIYPLWSNLRTLYVIGTSLRWLQMSVIVEAATYAKNDWPPTLHDVIFIFNIIFILYFNIVEETEF